MAEDTPTSELTVAQALDYADRYSEQAMIIYQGADKKLRLEGIAIEIARAQLMQTRALTYYQFAATHALRN